MNPSRPFLSLKAKRSVAAALLMVAATALNAQTSQPTFETATVKPALPGADPNQGAWSLPGKGRFTATHLTLEWLIRLAYDVDSRQIANKPAWLATELFDVNAKPEEGVSLSREELRPRLQELLRQRFHLKAHLETRSSRGYALVVGKGGQHLTPTKGDHFPGYRIQVNSGHMQTANCSMPQLARFLTEAAAFPVADKTGITGSYDISFLYEPNPEAESNLQSLPQALKTATGLELHPENISVQTVVIDSVDRTPTQD